MFKKKIQWQSDLTDHACSSSLRFTVYIVILLILLADLSSCISAYWLSVIIKDIYWMQGLNFEIIVIKFFSEVLDVKYIIKTF